MDADVRVVELASLAGIGPALRGCADGEIVVVVPPGSHVDRARLLDAYAALDGTVVVGATTAPAVPPQVVSRHPHVSSPYRFVAPLLIGPARHLCSLGVAGIDELTERYLAGDDLELDVGAEIFLVRDGTGTDAVVLDGAVVATATGSRPAVVVGDMPPQPHADDLARVLAYRDAVVPAADVEIVAPEIIRSAFWTGPMCGAIVRAAEAVDAWSADPDDPVPGTEVSLATISPRCFAAVEAHFGELLVPRLRSVWPAFAWNGIHDAFVIKYTAGTDADALPLHHDVAQLSATVRLNDGYRGGWLEFPRQQWDNRAVPVGDIVVWPSLVTHPHRSTPVTAGVRYGLTIWTRLPE